MAEQLSDAEIIAQLRAALLRTRYVWSNHIHYLCHNLYPERVPGSRDQTSFSGNANERIFEIYKIMDSEARRNVRTLKALSLDKDLSDEEALIIFDELSKATGISNTSHNKDH